MDFYEIISLLGEGSYAKVYLGKSVLCEEFVAIKCYNKTKIGSSSTFTRIIQEIELMRNLDHPNVIKIYEIFENSKFIFIVLEYVDNGDLLSYMKKYGTFTEQHYIPIFFQILNALNYLHSLNILHRDIKLDNILLNKEGEVKICDFGVSRRMRRDKIIFEHIGTPAYLSPEIVKEKGYKNFASDIWSTGVMSYIALSGYVPFKGESIKELNQSIISEEVEFDHEILNFSIKMKFILNGMLRKNPLDRFTLYEVSKYTGIDLLHLPLAKDKRLDRNRIKQIMAYGIEEESILYTLENNKINHIQCLYMLLEKKIN